MLIGIMTSTRVGTAGCKHEDEIEPWFRAGMSPGSRICYDGRVPFVRTTIAHWRPAACNRKSASQPSFADLIGRLHQDDRAAVGLLVERYGDALRRSIERALLVRRLAGSGLGSGRDPVGPEASDIFQTVLLLFLVRLRRHRDGSSGALHFEAPGQLVAYLKAIAEHELNRRPSRRDRPARGGDRSGRAAGPRAGLRRADAQRSPAGSRAPGARPSRAGGGRPSPEPPRSAPSGSWSGRS